MGLSTEPSAYTPQPGTIPARTLNFGPKLRQGAAGQEKLCVRCDCWLPATRAHFYAAPSERGGLFYCCKRCYRDWRAAKASGLPTRLVDEIDDVDLVVVQRVVPAAEAAPLHVAPLAHGWIPSLEGVHLEVEAPAPPPRAPGRQVQVDEPSVIAATGLGWRAPSSTPSAPTAPGESAMREPETACAEQHPQRADGARGERHA